MAGSRWRVSAAVLCLVLGPLAMFLQFLVTPVPGGDASVPEMLSAVAAHRTAMVWALVLDVPVLLVIPALFCAGLLAGAATQRLAAIATALLVLPAIAAVVLIAHDALLYVAAEQANRAAAVALVQDFDANPLIAFLTFGYLLTHLVAYPLLAVALRRTGALALWPAVGLGLWPVLEVLGYGAGVKPVADAGYFLQLLALLLCAARLRGASRSAPVVRASAAHATS
jgi:hypothetical protein